MKLRSSELKEDETKEGVGAWQYGSNVGGLLIGVVMRRNLGVVGLVKTGVANEDEEERSMDGGADVVK